MKNLHYTYLALLLFVLSCCSKNIYTSEPSVDAARYDTLIILSTNDVHAHIDNMPKEAAYIENIKKQYSSVLVLSAGDIFSGSPVVDQYPQRGYPIVALMNLMGYQAMSLGNHDFDYGQSALNDRAAQANFPFLCANADFSKTALAGKIKPYKIFTINGVKVAVLALLQTSSQSNIPSTAPGNVKDITFSYALNKVNQYASLRDSAAVFVILSHLGADDDRKLAAQFPKADIIVGGHSHTLLNPAEMQNGVLITQTGANLNNIGKTMVVLKNGKIEEKNNAIIATSTLTAVNAAIQDSVNKYKSNPWLLRVIGEATANFSGKDALGNLMTDAVREQHQLDIAFTNNGGIRIHDIPKGNITLSKIYELDPFGNDVVVYDMSLSDMETLLKHTCRNGEISLQISGAKYAYNTTAKTITLTNYDGQPLSSSKRYKLGMNSYVAETEMPKALPSLQGTYLFITTAETLVKYIEKEKQVTPQPQRAFVQN